jgi:hypothetical protein
LDQGFGGPTITALFAVSGAVLKTSGAWQKFKDQQLYRLLQDGEKVVITTISAGS